MRALLDEMIPPAVAEQLRARGHDVVAVTERPDLRTRTDHDVLAEADADGRVVVTLDRVDYLGLDREYRMAGRSHAGIVLVPARHEQRDIGSLVKALDALLADDEPYAGFVHWL